MVFLLYKIVVHVSRLVKSWEINVYRVSQSLIFIKSGRRSFNHENTTNFTTSCEETVDSQRMSFRLWHSIWFHWISEFTQICNQKGIYAIIIFFVKLKKNIMKLRDLVKNDLLTALTTKLLICGAPPYLIYASLKKKYERKPQVIVLFCFLSFFSLSQPPSFSFSTYASLLKLSASSSNMN